MSGFNKHHSTQAAIPKVTNDVPMDRALLVLPELSSAFSLPHRMILIDPEDPSWLILTCQTHTFIKSKAVNFFFFLGGGLTVMCLLSVSVHLNDNKSFPTQNKCLVFLQTMNTFKLYSSFFFNCMPNFEFYVLMVCLGLGKIATWLGHCA